jgi:predicted DNA-binding transcriptional regulator YafY
MVRVNQVRKAERLNHARQLLRRVDHLPDAVARMARDCSISPRQAYRYLEEARQLTGPVPVGDEKIAFTVKLSRGLVAQVRSYARTKRLSLSELVSRALGAWLPRR